MVLVVKIKPCMIYYLHENFPKQPESVSGECSIRVVEVTALLAILLGPYSITFSMHSVIIINT